MDLFSWRLDTFELFDEYMCDKSVQNPEITNSPVEVELEAVAVWSNPESVLDKKGTGRLEGLLLNQLSNASLLGFRFSHVGPCLVKVSKGDRSPFGVLLATFQIRGKQRRSLRRPKVTQTKTKQTTFRGEHRGFKLTAFLS